MEDERVVINKPGSVLVDSRVSGLLMVCTVFYGSYCSAAGLHIYQEKQEPGLGESDNNKTLIVRKFHFNWSSE